MDNKVRLTGLWKNTDKQGNIFLTGTINPSAGVMILPNTFKKPGENGPDFYLYIVPKEKDEGATRKKPAVVGL